eukprot:CAMPEP_0185852644 /NCGR_PEP_ID=MMETSP1354-20130828/15666_1 /TAXON_ID=708628 /ORGANISM="Erythrolobus madagascarensis, Strain CCMP3276" /LENGTH=54 /DNA_ID=CAMNT_0028553949 /DNA_START=52 /DNA_END=214 /DNA_ORIENTATION=+
MAREALWHHKLRVRLLLITDAALQDLDEAAPHSEHFSKVLLLAGEQCIRSRQWW